MANVNEEALELAKTLSEKIKIALLALLEINENSDNQMVVSKVSQYAINEITKEFREGGKIGKHNG